MRRLGIAILILVACVYLSASLYQLENFPPIYEDEPYIAAPAYKLATEGIYGSDLLAGYYGIEHHYYAAPPLYHLALSLVIRVFGIGLLQLRILPFVAGFLVLALVGWIGSRQLDARIGPLAASLLVFECLSKPYVDRTGIPLLDMARIGRIDIPVALFGLSALARFNHLEATRDRPGGYLAVGVLVGLATLTHLYGAFWLLSFLAILGLRHGWRAFRRSEAHLMVVGFLLAEIPWAIYVAMDPRDWAKQATLHAERYDFLNPMFYVSNALHEFHRYDIGFFGFGFGAVIVVIAALVFAASELRKDRSFIGSPVFAVFVALVVHAGSYAFLLQSKSRFYVLDLWCIAVLVIAWAGIAVWSRYRSRLVRAPIALVFAAVIFQGTVRIIERARIASSATSYAEYEARLSAIIPPGTLVLGLQHYWIGLRDHPYRSWLLPLYFCEPQNYEETLTLDVALERIHPDVIVIDPFMRRYFDELRDPSNPRHSELAAYERFIARHRSSSIGAVDDPTYGRTEAFLVTYDP